MVPQSQLYDADAMERVVKEKTDALRAEVEALKGALAAHGRGQEVIIDDNVALRADLDAARELTAAAARAQLRLVDDLDATRKLLEACVHAMRMQESRADESFHLDAGAFMPIWDKAANDAEAFLAQKKGG